MHTQYAQQPLYAHQLHKINEREVLRTAEHARFVTRVARASRAERRSRWTLRK